MNNSKSIPIFFFSGTGNTWWVSQRLAESLSERGFRARAHSIEQVSPDQTAELIRPAALIGLGFPIYGSDAPRLFHEFLQALPHQSEEKAVLGFVTQAGWSGDGFNFLSRSLQMHGYRLRWAAEFNMPNNICLDIIPFPFSPDYERFTSQLADAKSRVDELAEKVAQRQDWRQNNGLLSAALAWLQRAPFRLTHDWGRKYWSVDADRCNSCGGCERNCPTDNIHMEAGLPVYGLDCTYCMRCFNYCPTLAVRYMNSRNRRVSLTPPFQGPVPEFHPKLIARQR